MKPFLCRVASVKVPAHCSAFAERNLVPSMDGASDICPDRPEEPQWMQNIGVRDACRPVLVQDICHVRNLERIVKAGECSCETRFPVWDVAEAEFFGTSLRQRGGKCWKPPMPMDAKRTRSARKSCPSVKLRAIGRKNHR